MYKKKLLSITKVLIYFGTIFNDFIDEDGDRVTLTSDLEVKEAVNFAITHTNSTLTLTISNLNSSTWNSQLSMSSPNFKSTMSTSQIPQTLSTSSLAALPSGLRPESVSNTLLPQFFGLASSNASNVNPQVS